MVGLGASKRRTIAGWLARLGAAAVAVMALTELLGRTLADRSVLLPPRPELPPTAAGLFVLSLAILAAHARRPAWRRAASLLAVVPILLGAAVLLRFLPAVDDVVRIVAPGMRGVTGGLFVLLGAATSSAGIGVANRRWNEMLASGALVLAAYAVSPEAGTGAGVAMAFVFLALVVAYGRPEARAEAARFAAGEREKRLAAELAVARHLARSESLRDALPAVLEAVCENLDWDVGAAWALDGEAGVLRCVETWHRPPIDASAFETATRAQGFLRGVGLPGRVWASGEALWISDVAAQATFVRGAVASKSGLRAAVAVPVRVGDEALGALEFFSWNVRRRDEATLEVLVAAGAAVARFVAARRAEERLREEITTLEKLHQLTVALSGELDLEKLVQSLTDAATSLVGAQSGTFYGLRNGNDSGYVAYASSATSRDAFGLPRPGRVFMPSFSSDGPVRIADLRREARNGDRVPDFGGNAAPGAVASYLAVPVVTRAGHMTGGLAFAHVEPGRFTEREERIATAFAAQIAVMIENTELYEAERSARRGAEAANRAKEEFLAMLGHELRNPIGAIRNSVQALEASQATTEAGRLLCAILGRQTETLAHLVDDLLDVSRLMSGKIRLRRRVVDLKEIAEQALQSLRAAGKAARHFVQLNAQSVLVDGDPVRLEQIVTNLVENALKYTQTGGEIEVAVERVGVHAQLRVRDDGQGIAPELLPKIFDLFTQGEQSLDRAKGGMGLGLALVRRLAELHGGSAEAESPGPGRGAEFRVRLAARPEAERPVERSLADLVPQTPRHVLIIEDHGDSRESLRLLLEVSGHRVDVAPNGFDGLELALTRHPEIAIIDIGIPGIDGYQVAREIRSSDVGYGIYLVALTGYGQPIDRRRALESGFNEHMVKPVERERLLRLLESIEPAGPAGDVAA